MSNYYEIWKKSRGEDEEERKKRQQQTVQPSTEQSQESSQQPIKQDSGTDYYKLWKKSRGEDIPPEPTVSPPAQEVVQDTIQQLPVQEATPEKEGKKSFGAILKKFWNKVKGKKPEIEPVDVDNSHLLTRELFDFSDPEKLKTSTDIAFTKLRQVARDQKDENIQMLGELNELRKTKDLNDEQKEKLIEYFRRTTYLEEEKQYRVLGNRVFMKVGVREEEIPLQRMIPEIQESISKNLKKLELNERLIDEFTGKIKTDRGLFRVLADQIKTGELEPFVPDAEKAKSTKRFNSLVDKFKAGETLDTLSAEDKMSVVEFMNEQLEANLDRGFWSETMGITPSIRMSLEFALGSMMASATGIAGGGMAGVIGKYALSGGVAGKAKAESLKAMELHLAQTDQGEVYFNVTAGGMGEVEANNRAMISQGIQDIVEVVGGELFDKAVGVAGTAGKKALDKTLVPALSKTKLGGKAVKVAQSVLSASGQLLNNNTVLKSFMQSIGRNTFFSEVAEEVLQDIVAYIVEGEELNLANAEYWKRTIASTFVVTAFFGTANIPTMASDVNNKKRMLNAVKQNVKEFNGFEVNDAGELVYTKDGTVVRSVDMFKELYEQGLEGDVETEEQLQPKAKETPVVDVEEEMLKADIAQAESGLVAEPVQEVKIGEGKVKTDYSEDAKVQEVLRDINAVLDLGAKKKVVSQSEVEGEYVHGTEGVVIPEFIPEELRSRKYVQKAYDAFLNNTVPQEGTKAWQVYQAIIEESKGREGLEMQEPSEVAEKIESTKGQVLKEVPEIKGVLPEYISKESSNAEVIQLAFDSLRGYKNVSKYLPEDMKEEFNRVRDSIKNEIDTMIIRDSMQEEVDSGMTSKEDIATSLMDSVFLEEEEAQYKKENPKQYALDKYIEKVDKKVRDAGGYDKYVSQLEREIEDQQRVVDDYKFVFKTTLDSDMKRVSKDERYAKELLSMMKKEMEVLKESPLAFYKGEEITDDDLPFRQRELKVLEDKFLDNLTVERMKEFSREWFGDENVELVKNILRNKKALGMYLNRLIEIKNGQAHVGSTFYHEAVHKAFDIFLTADEKKAMIKEVVKRVGKEKLMNEWNGKTSGEKMRLASYWSNALGTYNRFLETNVKKLGAIGIDNIVSKKQELKNEGDLLRNYAEKYNIDQNQMYSSFLQVKDKTTQEVSYYFIEGEMDAVHAEALVDNAEWGIAGEAIEGKTYHLTVIKPYTLKDPYANIKGKFDMRALPYSKNASQRSRQREYRNQFGITKNAKGMYRGVDAQVASVDAMAEEWLAENIIDYVNNRNSTTFWGKLKRMVDVFVDRLFRGVDHIRDIEDFYESLLSGRLLERQEKLEAKQQKNWGKYIASIQGTGMRTDEVYRTEVAKEVKKLTTKILKKLEGKGSVKKQFISDLAKQQDIKQVEKDIINDVLKKFPDQIDVATFEEKVLAELLPLKRQELGDTRYEAYTIDKNDPDWFYSENIYHSPISVTAGITHFNHAMGAYMEDVAEKYFGHTRVEDNNDGSVRRVIEVQSDLYQKGKLEREVQREQHIAWKAYNYMEETPTLEDILNDLQDAENYLRTLKEDASDYGYTKNRISLLKLDLETAKKVKEEKLKRGEEVKPLMQYKDPTAHLRMVREEVRQASLDGVKKLLFPTGNTARYIEGFVKPNKWTDVSGNLLKNNKGLEYGDYIRDTEYDDFWVVIGVDKNNESVITARPQRGIATREDSGMDFELGGVKDTLIKSFGYDFYRDGGYLIPEDSQDVIKYIRTKGGEASKDLFIELLRRENETAYKTVAKKYKTDINGLSKLVQKEGFEPNDLLDVANIYKDFNWSAETVQFGERVIDVPQVKAVVDFYDNTLGKYLKNQYGAEMITDKKDMTWFEVDIKPEYAGAVEAFRLDELVDYGKVAQSQTLNTKADPLITEARKYGSAEEFVEAQGKPLYHGGKKELLEIDLERRSLKTPDGEKFYAGLDLETAKMYGDIVTEIYLTDKNIKIADFTTIKVFEPSKSVLYRELKEDIKRYDGDTNNELWHFNTKKSLLHTLALQPELVSETPIVLEFLRKRGYQASITPSVYGKKHFIVLDGGKFKTKTQLTDIWNQAQDTAKYRLEDEEEVSVKLPELITMATELGANIKLQNKFRKNGKLGDFTAGEDTDSRIRILRTLFEPQGEEVMDGEGNVEKLPETPEQQMDRIHGIEKVLAHEIGHLFDWFGGTENMTLKRGNILGRIANLRNYTEGQFMDLENKEVRKELKTLTQVWNPFDEATAPKKYKTYRYSAKELYAEALSVFLNKPSLVKEVAPNFYQGFIEYMARKKEVQKEYFAIRDMIKQGSEVQSRVENMKKAQEIARGKRMTIDEEKEAYKKQSKWQEAITGIKMGFVNQYAPYLDKLRKAWKDKKITLSKLEEAEQLMGDLALKGNDAVKYAQDVQNEFFVPVSEAGIDMDTIGQILVLERNLGDRLDLANPHGLVYDYAKETYDYVKGQLTPAQWNLLSEKLSWWRDYNFDLVRKGYEAGVYSEQFFNEIATVNKNTYTPFAVVDYIEDNYVTAGVIQAVGTTKGVENPLTTQMLKSLSLMKLTATNGAKQDVVKSLAEIFPDEIVKADAIKDADGRTIGFKKNPKLERAGYTQLELLEDGKRTAYYMDRYIVSMFESSLNGVGWDIARFVTAPLRMVNRIFKPAVTVMKASFQFYSNPLKDYQRSLTNLTALSGLFDKSNVASRTAKVFGAFTKEWVKNLKRSWNYAGGEIDAITQKMLDMYVLSSNVKYEDIDIGNEKFKFDPVKNRIVYKGGVNWLETLRDWGSTIPVIKHTLVPVYDFYMRAGSTFEVNSKIAGFQYLSEKVGDEKASFYTRRYVGTPDYMQKGKFTPLTNELVVFSNVGIQAITADMDLATRPKTASGYWVSTMFKIVFPKLLMLLGASILRVPIPDPDDPEKKKWVNPYDYLSEYYKAMYMAFPIGYDEESESFMFVKAPSDEVGAVIGNLVWKMATYLQGEGMKVEQLGSAIAGLIPFTTGDNPLLSIGRDWMQYAQGRNPYDDFRGRLAINTSKWNEGGMTRFVEMLKWTGNEMGLTNFSTYDKSSDTTLEKTMNLPLLERMFELTNYGLQEREENEKALGKKEKNKTLDGYIESYFAEPSNKKLLELQEKYVIAIKGERPEGGWSGTEKAEETRLKSEFKREILANSGNAVYKSIAKAGLDNDEKLEIINKQKKQMNDEEFKDFMTQVVRYEVVKGEMFATYVKDKNLSQDLVYKVVKESIPVLSAESNNTLLWELRKVDAMSNDTLYKLAKGGLITSAGYMKYKDLNSTSYEKRYGEKDDDDNKTKLF